MRGERERGRERREGAERRLVGGGQGGKKRGRGKKGREEGCRRGRGEGEKRVRRRERGGWALEFRVQGLGIEF